MQSFFLMHDLIGKTYDETLLLLQLGIRRGLVALDPVTNGSGFACYWCHTSILFNGMECMTQEFIRGHPFLARYAFHDSCYRELFDAAAEVA